MHRAGGSGSRKACSRSLLSRQQRCRTSRECSSERFFEPRLPGGCILVENIGFELSSTKRMSTFRCANPVVVTEKVKQAMAVASKTVLLCVLNNMIRPRQLRLARTLAWLPHDVDLHHA